MLVWVRAVSVNASAKSPPFTLLKALAGKLARLEQFCHASRKLVPDDVSIRGKLVRPEQSRQAKEKLVPADVSIRGKLVRPVQECQAA